MRDHDSTNLRSPRFGPTFPDYPEVAQLVEAAGAALPGNIYPAFVRQWGTPLTTRRREPCYLVEPNGVQLGPAIYDARLVSSFQGLPLYATHCCLPAPSGSSSSSSASAIIPLRTPLGTAQGGYPTPLASLSLTNVTLPSNCLLVVIASLLGSAGDVGSVRWGPYTLGVDEDVGLPPTAALPGRIAALSATIDAGGTHDIVYTPTLAAFLTLQAVQVRNLYDDVSDQAASAFGVVSNPDSGATGVATGVPEFAQGAFLMLTPPGAWTWLNGFSSGGQDITAAVSGLNVAVTEGWKTLASLQSVQAALNAAAVSWAGLSVTYF